ncbi:diguanylate cyclase domain-containing protein [Methylocucumis oryzae]|uniref:diguanylate cyclase domain-containing protein n=1 Tax=Methylocucumis oryzae TaxID=1632867 RepID=UPI001955423B|nr:diguanylate cyclase [Methylocucumis oryzae]
MLNRNKYGETYHEEKTITPLKDTQGNITHYVSTGRDISEKVIAEQAQARLVAILEATPDLVVMFASEGQINYLNKSGVTLLKLKNADQLAGLKFFDLFPSNIVEQALRTGLGIAMEVGTWSSEVVMQAADGSEAPVSLVILAHYDSINRLSYFSAIARDISERMHFEAELKHQSTHDPLTQLPNRLVLEDRLATEIERARRLNCLAAVLFLDVNNFKRINDSLGHTIGDSLMQQIAIRLVLSLDSDDTVARYGGDEFAIVVGDLPNIDHLQGLLTRIRVEFERPFTFSEQVTYVTLSIGIAVYPYDGLEVDDLLRNAGTAMYWSKASGSNHYRFYAPKMNARSHERFNVRDRTKRRDKKQRILFCTTNRN